MHTNSDRQTERQTDRQTDRHNGRNTDRLTEGKRDNNINQKMLSCRYKRSENKIK